MVDVGAAEDRAPRRRRRWWSEAARPGGRPARHERRPYEGFAESSMAGEARTLHRVQPVRRRRPTRWRRRSCSAWRTTASSARGCSATPTRARPGCVHGGFIAGAFDEVLGFTMSFTGLIGMTGPPDGALPQAHAAAPAVRFEGRRRPASTGARSHPAPRLHADGVLTGRGRGPVHRRSIPRSSSA